MGNDVVKIKVMREEWADPAIALPAYATAGAAGADLRANFAPEQRGSGITLEPMARALVPTGIRVALPEGVEMQVRPRSGLALTHGVTLVNTPGTIDWDYRGPLGVILINLGQSAFCVEHGMRIAQAVIAPVARATLVNVEGLSTTHRGAAGFGSTGTG